MTPHTTSTHRACASYIPPSALYPTRATYVCRTIYLICRLVGPSPHSISQPARFHDSAPSSCCPSAEAMSAADSREPYTPLRCFCTPSCRPKDGGTSSTHPLVSVPSKRQRRTRAQGRVNAKCLMERVSRRRASNPGHSSTRITRYDLPFPQYVRHYSCSCRPAALARLPCAALPLDRECVEASPVPRTDASEYAGSLAGGSLGGRLEAEM